MRRNATILPVRLQNLYVHLRAHDDVAEFMPLMPHELGSNERMKKIFRIVEEFLGESKNNSYQFHAWLASEWIHDVPLRRIIDERIRLLRKRGKFKSVGDTIRDLMRAIESDLRHRYVKHTKAYNDVLAQVLRDTGKGDWAGHLKPLHLFLECGALHPVALSLISLGLSRTTALLLKRKIRFPEDASPEQCKAIVAKSEPDKLAIPALCRAEIKKVLYG